MSDEKPHTDPSETPTRVGGAAGPRVNVRKGLQGGLLVAALLIVFTAPADLDRRLFLFGTMIVVVLIDLVMLWRGDLDYTHFRNRTWSFRFNAVLLLVAIGLFALAASRTFEP